MIKNVFIFTLLQTYVHKGEKYDLRKGRGYDFQCYTYLDPCIFENIFIAGIVKMHLLCFFTLFTHRWLAVFRMLLTLTVVFACRPRWTSLKGRRVWVRSVSWPSTTSSERFRSDSLLICSVAHSLSRLLPLSAASCLPIIAALSSAVAVSIQKNPILLFCWYRVPVSNNSLI